MEVNIVNKYNSIINDLFWWELIEFEQNRPQAGSSVSVYHLWSEIAGSCIMASCSRRLRTRSSQ